MKVRKTGTIIGVILITALAGCIILLIGIKKSFLAEKSITITSKTQVSNFDQDGGSTRNKKERKIDGLAAALKSIEDQRKKEEVEGTNIPVPYDMFGQSGQLTTAAAEAAGLSQTERSEVERILLDAWNAAADRFAADATLDEARSNPNEGCYGYRIRALSDRGLSNLKALHEALNSAIGEERQKILTKGMNKYDCFGGFGALDIEIELSKSNQSYTYKYINPQTGKPSRFGTSSIEEFSNQFGDTFDLNHFMNENSNRVGAHEIKRRK